MNGNGKVEIEMEVLVCDYLRAVVSDSCRTVVKSEFHLAVNETMC